MNRIEFVLVLLFTFFVIVVWITSDVVLAHPQKAEDPKVQKLPSMLEALSPNFDTKTIEEINNQKQSQKAPFIQPAAPPIQTASPIASPTTQKPSPTPKASPLPSSSAPSAELFGNDNNIANTTILPSPSPTPLASP